MTGGRGRLIAGSAFGVTSGVRTHSPLFYAHLELAAGARVEVPRGTPSAPPMWWRCRRVGGGSYGAKTMIVFPGERRSRAHRAGTSTVMMLGGEPVGPRHVWWNFVSSRQERIEQAKVDWSTGPIGPPDGRRRIDTTTGGL